MTDAFVIEVNDEAAGIIVRSGRDYLFYASHPRYAALEGSAFASPSKAELAALALKRPQSRPQAARKLTEAHPGGAR